MTMRNFLSFAFILAVVFTSWNGAVAQSSVEEVFKEDTASGAQEQWAHNPPRIERPWVVSLETAWNGLSGIGPIVHYYPVPHLAIEAGVGLAGTGLKTGVRMRGVFGKKKTSGFLGIGFTSGSGAGDTEMKLEGDNNNPTITYKLKRTNFLQFTTGVDVVAKRGFFFLGTFGWSQCLNKDNLIIVSGQPTSAQSTAFDITFRGGLILGLDMGYAIRTR